MKIVLSNGTDLNPIIVVGGTRYVQGVHRDTLSFVFSADAGLDVLDEIFTESACESIIIVGDDNSEAVHSGYTIRAELSRKTVDVSDEDSLEPVYEDRIFVVMAQRIFSEDQIAANTAALNILLTGEAK